jgi:hypothetical protein
MANVAEEKDTLKIAKLKGQINWTNWKTNIEFILIDKELDDYVLKDMPVTLGDDGKAEWKRKSRKALAILGLYMDVSQQRHIRACTTAREAYVKLTGLFDCKDQATQLAKQRVFLTLAQNEGESVVNWIARVEAEAAECHDSGMDVDNQIVAVILNGLSPAFDTAKTIILHEASRPDRELSVQYVQKVLVGDETAALVAGNSNRANAFWARERERDNRRQNSQGERSSRGQGKDRGNKDQQGRKKCETCSRFGCKCHHCGFEGHHIKDCRRKKEGKPPAERRTDNKEAEDKNVHVLMAVVEGELGPWVLDSGCSRHIVNDRSAFQDLRPVTGVRVDLGGKDHTIVAAGQGTASFMTVVNSKSTEIKLTNSLYVPEARASLISLGCLLDKGATVLTGRHETVISKGGDVLFKAYRTADLWHVPVQQSEKPQTFALKASASNELTMDLVHRRLGH